MDENERTALNEMTALEGTRRAPEEHGVSIRHISMESLGVLELIGHPIAGAMHAVMNGEERPTMKMGTVDLIELLWVLSEDQDKVLEIALTCTPVAKYPATKAAMTHIRKFEKVTQSELLEAVQRAAGLDVMKTEAAAFEVTDTGTKKKGEIG